MPSSKEYHENLIMRLKALANAEHDDLSVAAEAAHTIESLLAAVEQSKMVIIQQMGRMGE